MAKDSRTGQGGAPLHQPKARLGTLLGIETQETRRHALKAESWYGVWQERRLDHHSLLSALEEPHSLRPDIAELRARFSEEPGMNGKPCGEELPLQKIYGHDGRVLLEGHAASVQDLIQNSLKSCAESSDPAKQTLDLSGANLSTDPSGQPLKLNFSCFNFQNVNLNGADLRGSSFDRCQFRNVGMEGACLKDTSFMICHFEQTNMAHFSGDDQTTFRNSSLYRVNMSGADAPGLKLHNVRGQYVDCADANLAGASIAGVTVENLGGANVNLTGAGIGGFTVCGGHSTLDGASLIGATIGSSHFGSRECPISMCGLRADYSTWSNSEIVADLSGASFVDGSFDGLDIRFSFTPDGPIKVAGALLGGLARSGCVQLDPPGSSAASSSAPQFGRGRNRF